MEKYATRRQRWELKAMKRKRIIIAIAFIVILCLMGFVVAPLVIKYAGVRLFKTNKYGSESIVYSDARSIPDYSGEDYIILNEESNPPAKLGRME